MGGGSLTGDVLFTSMISESLSTVINAISFCFSSISSSRCPIIDLSSGNSLSAVCLPPMSSEGLSNC